MIDLLKPIFSDCDKCIILCSNNDFMPVAAIMLQSIVKNSKADKKYDIIILHEDITKLTQTVVTNLFKENNISVRFCDIGNYISGKHFFVQNKKNFTKEAYFRLLIPWILDDAYNYALYVDGDMIALKDIYDIFDYNLGDNLIGAVRDYWGIWNCYSPGDASVKPKKRVYRESISLTDIDEYVISATIIFNLRLFREKYTLDYVVALAASKNWEQHDQDVINLLCKGKIKHISAIWGLLPYYNKIHNLPEYMQEELLQAKEDPIIVHFGAMEKPWLRTYVDYFLDFWRYALETPFFKVLFEKIKSDEYKNYIAYALSTEKHGNMVCVYEGNDIKRYFEGSSLGGLSCGHTEYRKISIEKGVLYLEGMVGFFGISLESAIKICLLINDKEIVEVVNHEREDGFNKRAHLYTFRGEAFTFSYKLNPTVDTYKIKIICYLDVLPLEKINLGFGRFCPLSRVYKHSYCQYGEWVVTTDNRILTIKHIKPEDGNRYETAFLKELVKIKKKACIKAACVRMAVRILKPFIKKPIWLITDRLTYAGDNGEVFFKYLSKKDDVYSFFVINSDSKDFPKLQQYGRVIGARSAKHKLLTLLADFVISSQSDDVFRNPFGKYFEPYKDLLSKVKFVFLQHGVISNDMSNIWKKNKQYFTGFITTTYKEYQELLEGKYGYSKQEIWLTGMPRLDLLTDNKEKVITIMPTWRYYLTTGFDSETGKCGVVDGFSESAYVKGFKSLLSNQKLREWAKRLNYKIQFKIHPVIAAQKAAFGFDKDVVVVDENVSSMEIYSESCLIVTDYSSSVYDFVYLNKPVIYYQFDIDEFFSGKHLYDKGDYNYELEGFGDVCYDEETLVDTIIQYMQNDCKLKDKYKERIEKAFAFHDKNNCQRIYDAILGIMKTL